ncbi:MAG: divalent-cation tolerance protein CutA [Candidatus Anstonellales archaeon]
MVILYVPFPNRREAKKAAQHLLRKKLIACVNIFACESIYEWKGKKESTKESVAIFKTSEKNENKLRKEIEKIHPYELPAIIKFDCYANALFEKWVQKQTTP